MMTIGLRKWFSSNGSFIQNTGSLIATTLLTSGLGFVYWWIAARLFTAEAVGLSAALTSSMLMLGNIGRLGLDNFLISELPKRGKLAPRLLISSLWLSGGVALAFGLSFAWLSPFFAKDVHSYFDVWSNTLSFALGVALTSLSMVLDKALIAYMWGSTQLWRNILFSVLKILFLFMVAWIFIGLGDAGIINSWILANLISLAFVFGLLARRLELPALPHKSAFNGLGLNIFNHYFLDIAQSAHALIMPLLSVSLFGASLSGAFYVAWTFILMGRMIPMHITTVLHALGSRDRELLRSKMRMTLKLSFLLSFVVCSVLFFASGPLLGLFGREYAEFAADPLQILAFIIFPYIIKVHYLALARVQHFVAKAAFIMTIFAVLEILITLFSASIGGLMGMSYALLFLSSLEALVLLPSIWKTVK